MLNYFMRAGLKKIYLSSQTVRLAAGTSLTSVIGNFNFFLGCRSKMYRLFGQSLSILLANCKIKELN